MINENRDDRGDLGRDRPGYDEELGLRISVVVDLYDAKNMAAEAANVTWKQLARYLRGLNQPAFVTLAKLCAPKGVSLDWLATGEGPMLVRDRMSQSASEIERALGADEVPLNDGLLANVVEGLETWLAAEDLAPDWGVKARLISVLYRLMAMRGIELAKSGQDTTALDQSGHPIDIQGDAMLRGIVGLVR